MGLGETSGEAIEFRLDNIEFCQNYFFQKYHDRLPDVADQPLCFFKSSLVPSATEEQKQEEEKTPQKQHATKRKSPAKNAAKQKSTKK